MATLPTGLHRLEQLTKYVIHLAQQILEKHGAFFPFGAVIDIDGNMVPATADTGKADAKTHEVYQLLQESMRAQFVKGEIVAGAIVADVTIPADLKPDYPDGIRVLVESSTVSRLVFVPYKKTEGSPSATTEAATAGSQGVQYGEYLGVNVLPSLFVGTRG